MAYTYLITETELKQDTIIQNNVDGKLLGWAMRKAQDIYTRAVLGTALYNQIITEFAASSLTAANQTLLDSYIVPMQREYIQKEATFALWIKFTNSSIGTRSVDDLQTSGQEQVNYAVNEFERAAEYWKDLLIKYICDNIADYPLYNTGDQEIEPNTKSYTSRFTFTNEINEEVHKRKIRTHII